MIEEDELEIAVVTFSPQTELIQEVLAATFGDAVAKRIQVRGGSPFNYGFDLGKQAHISSLDLPRDCQNSNILLIDDDIMNILHARRNGMQWAHLYTSDPQTYSKI